MDVSPSALIRNFLPAVPGIVYTGLAALLGQTPNSTHQDALTQTIVAAVRPILRSPAALGRSQRVWCVLGLWAAKGMECVKWIGLGWVLGVEGVIVWEDVVRAEKSPDVYEKMGEGERKVMDAREAVKFAFDVLKDPKHGAVSCDVPEVVDVPVEWTASSNVDPLKPVILYLHGGAHCLMDPTTHRWTTSTLSKLSGLDVCSVRFRLSPQHPFPAALLDAFTVYLSLLATRQPTSIILAGDSSGGGLASSLLLLLLTLSTHHISIQHLTIPSPPCAGLALTSPWLDISRSLPSTTANSKWDIIAPPPLDSASPPFPADDLWPTLPPRTDTYCNADMCTHPLVSPLAARSERWRGAPPVWLCAGWEGFTDEIEVFARRLFGSGDEAIVVFQGWEGMPHCFGMLPWGRQGWTAMKAWARFCTDAVSRLVKRREEGVWTGRGGLRYVRMEDLGLEMEGVGYERKLRLTDEVVEQMMEKSRAWRMGLESELVRDAKLRV